MPWSVLKRTDFTVLNADTSKSIDMGLLDIYILFLKFLHKSLYFMPNDYNCIDTCSLGWGGEDMITSHYTVSVTIDNVRIQDKTTGF